MRQVRPWSARARRRRRLGVSLAAIALVLLATAVVNVWLAVTTDAGWPLIVAGLELLGGLTVALYAYRYLRRAWLTASMPEESPAIVSTKNNSIAGAHD
jgi:hypothetical protein